MIDKNTRLAELKDAHTILVGKVQVASEEIQKQQALIQTLSQEGLPLEGRIAELEFLIAEEAEEV